MLLLPNVFNMELYKEKIIFFKLLYKIVPYNTDHFGQINKIPVFRVTLPYLNLLVEPRIFSRETNITLVNVNAPVVATTSWWLHFTAQVVA